jgi:hypothetical protein
MSVRYKERTLSEEEDSDYEDPASMPLNYEGMFSPSAQRPACPPPFMACCIPANLPSNWSPFLLASLAIVI